MGVQVYVLDSDTCHTFVDANGWSVDEYHHLHVMVNGIEAARFSRWGHVQKQGEEK